MGGGGGGLFLKNSNTLTTSPNLSPIPTLLTPPPEPIPIPYPTDPLTLSLAPSFSVILHSPGFEFQTSDQVHLHLHYATQAIVANLLIFVGLISYWSRTHPSPLTQINLGWLEKN